MTLMQKSYIFVNASLTVKTVLHGFILLINILYAKFQSKTDLRRIFKYVKEFPFVSRLRKQPE